MKNTRKHIFILFAILSLILSSSFAATKNEKDSKNWLDKSVPSIKETYEDIFVFF